MVSVPDLEVLAELILDDSLSHPVRDEVIQMMFGGQKDDYDYHKTGFYFEYLEELLITHKFCNIQRVSHFGYFKDSSDLIFEVMKFIIHIVSYYINYYIILYIYAIIGKKYFTQCDCNSVLTILIKHPNYIYSIK
jgi:hypothetical protein